MSLTYTAYCCRIPVLKRDIRLIGYLGKPVKIRRCPATVIADDACIRPLPIVGGKARAEDEARARRPDPVKIATPLRGKCGAGFTEPDPICTPALNLSGRGVLFLRAASESAPQTRGSDMFFTGRGDLGITSVIGGPALPKCNVRLEALGALDEAQSYLGLARSLLLHTSFAEPILRVQHDLTLLMTECAMASRGDPLITDKHTARLEKDMALWKESAGGFRGFTVSGDTIAGAHIHFARTVIRRAERRVVALLQSGGQVSPEMLAYLNRLSSWAYMLAAAAAYKKTDCITVA